jgi:DNA-binding winged helix-turn-helix (wHTH) protein
MFASIILWVTHMAEHAVYEFEGFRLDTGRRQLLDRGGEAIVMPPKVFDTLRYFVEHRGKLLDKDELLTALWPGFVVDENRLNQHISILRRTLGEKPSEHRFIVTIPRRGYQFVAEVRPVRGGPGHTGAQVPKTTHDLAAHELYLQARAVFEMPDEQRLRRAIVWLEQALARDPLFARALSMLAGVQLHCILFGYRLPNALRDAERNATRALEIDPALQEAHVALGQANAFRGRFNAAEKHFRSALTDGAGDAVSAVIYCTCLLNTAGHFSRAEREIHAAQRRAPASFPVAMCLALLSSMRGMDSEAMRCAELSVALGIPPLLAPIPQIRAHTERRAGRMNAAAAHLRESLHPALRELDGEPVVQSVFDSLRGAHKATAAAQAVCDLTERARAAGVAAPHLKDLIVWCGLLGETDRAHDLACALLDDCALEETVGSAWESLWMPEMRAFRRHPRFHELVTRLGLFHYWAEYGPPDGHELRNGRLVGL